MISELIEAGMDVARMNFSHSDHSSHKKVFETLRLCEQRSGRPLGILADLHEYFILIPIPIHIRTH